MLSSVSSSLFAGVTLRHRASDRQLPHVGPLKDSERPLVLDRTKCRHPRSARNASRSRMTPVMIVQPHRHGFVDMAANKMLTATPDTEQ